MCSPHEVHTPKPNAPSQANETGGGMPNVVRTINAQAAPAIRWPYLSAAPEHEEPALRGAVGVPWPLQSIGLGVTQEGLLSQSPPLFDRLQAMVSRWQLALRQVEAQRVEAERAEAERAEAARRSEASALTGPQVPTLLNTQQHNPHPALPLSRVARFLPRCLRHDRTGVADQRRQFCLRRAEGLRAVPARGA